MPKSLFDYRGETQGAARGTTDEVLFWVMVMECSFHIAGICFPLRE